MWVSLKVKKANHSCVEGPSPGAGSDRDWIKKVEVCATKKLTEWVDYNCSWKMHGWLCHRCSLYMESKTWWFCKTFLEYPRDKHISYCSIFINMCPEGLSFLQNGSGRYHPLTRMWLYNLHLGECHEDVKWKSFVKLSWLSLDFTFPISHFPCPLGLPKLNISSLVLSIGSLGEVLCHLLVCVHIYASSHRHQKNVTFNWLHFQNENFEISKQLCPNQVESLIFVQHS